MTFAKFCKVYDAFNTRVALAIRFHSTLKAKVMLPPNLQIEPFLLERISFAYLSGLPNVSRKDIQNYALVVSPMYSISSKRSLSTLENEGTHTQIREIMIELITLGSHLRKREVFQRRQFLVVVTQL